MRVAPRWWIGILVWIAYVVVIFTVGLLSGVPYDRYGDSADTLFRGPVLFLAAGAVLLVVATSVLGWWKPALRDERRSCHAWPIIAPALMAVAIVISLTAGVDWSRIDGGYLAGLLLLGALVGFNEELVNRGILLTSLRGTVREVWVWFSTSALFGLMHATNLFFGQELLPTLQQIGIAFLGGTAFYIVRRVSGSLIWAMVLHGAWDFTTFAVGHAPGQVAFGPLLGTIAQGLALVFVFWTFRSKGEDAAPSEPAIGTARTSAG
ncbi:lysostaphin resistance A-like protein [Agromyces sp. NPDC056379]|uniref:CPBP family intramembrane glutamic endopeptidase n=1 Tax=unclassified Agromyces TaxID=2639701 RepID=UPI0035DF052D